jgi:MFS family permease
MDPHQGEETGWRYAGWRVVLAAFFGVLAGFGTLVFYTFGLFIKPLTAEFGWSREAVSGAFGVSSMSIALFSPAAGHLLDRWGARKVILPTLLVFGLAFASLAYLTGNLVHLYSIFILLGVVGNACGQMGYCRAVSTWFERRRGLALAFVMAGTGIGAIVIPIIAQSLISTAGWRAAYALLGTLSLVLSLPLAVLFVREKTTGTMRARARRQPGLTLRESLGRREFWILTATLFLAAFSMSGAVIHLSALLSDRGLSPQSAAYTVSTLGGAGLLGRLITGLLLDRFFGPRVSLCLLAISGCGVVLLSGASSLATGMTAAFLIGLGMGGESDVVPYLLTRYFGLRSFSTLYGFTWTAYAVATSLSSVLLGRVFDATGSYQVVLFQIATLTFVAAGLMALMRRYPAQTVFSERSGDSPKAAVAASAP